MEEEIILAKFIEMKRKRKGLTQSSVAKILGVARTTYQDREKGCSLDIQFLRNYSEQVLEMSLSDFMTDYDHFYRAEFSSIYLIKTSFQE